LTVAAEKYAPPDYMVNSLWTSLGIGDGLGRRTHETVRLVKNLLKNKIVKEAFKVQHGCRLKNQDNLMHDVIVFSRADFLYTYPYCKQHSSA